jgi:D-apiose dehydrogenase
MRKPGDSQKGVAVGAGYFARFHYDAWQRLGGLAALCDTNGERAREAAITFGVPCVYSDVETMLDAEKPDFLDIITPPGSHIALVKLAAKYKASVICQKPLATAFSEAREIVEIAEDANIRLMVHENFRFQPWHREIKRQLNAGTIGALQTITIQTRLGDGWQPDAYKSRQPYFRTMEKLLIVETGVHFLDLMRFFGGEISRVSAWLTRRNPEILGEDSGLVVAELASGVRATWDADRYAEPLDGKDPRFTFGAFLLEGSAGRLRLETSGRLTRKRLGQPEDELSYSYEPRGFAGDCVFATLKHFCDALASGAPFETEGRTYLSTLAAQDAVYRAAETGLPQNL